MLLSEEVATLTGLHVGNTLNVWAQSGLATWRIIGIVRQSTNNFGYIGAAVTTVQT